MHALSQYLQLLKERGLRDTEPRRRVLALFLTLKRPATPQEIWHKLRGKTGMDLVTVYRILDRFKATDLVHAHPDATFSLCRVDHHAGHHGFLRCTKCGSAEEFDDPTLCRRETAIARKAKFSPVRHISEIIGYCRRCAT